MTITTGTNVGKSTSLHYNFEDDKAASKKL